MPTLTVWRITAVVACTHIRAVYMDAVEPTRNTMPWYIPLLSGTFLIVPNVAARKPIDWIPLDIALWLD